jgi:hypothetical protein
LLRLWLDGRSPHTRRAYATDLRSLLPTAGKPIATLTLPKTAGLGTTTAPGGNVHVFAHIQLSGGARFMSARPVKSASDRP